MPLYFSYEICIKISFVFKGILCHIFTFSHDEWPGVMEPHVSYAAIPRHFTEGKVLKYLVEHGVVHVTASEELFPKGQSDDLAIRNVYQSEDIKQWREAAFKRHARI